MAVVSIAGSAPGREDDDGATGTMFVEAEPRRSFFGGGDFLLVTLAGGVRLGVTLSSSSDDKSSIGPPKSKSSDS